MRGASLVRGLVGLGLVLLGVEVRDGAAAQDVAVQAEPVTPVNAAVSPGSRPATRSADALFAGGVAAFNAGKFEDALASFERAYAVQARPRFLLEVARAADAAGRRERAIEAYSAYLVAFPSAPKRGFAEARLSALRGASKAATETPATKTIVKPEVAAIEEADDAGLNEVVARQLMERRDRLSRSRTSFTAPIVLGVAGTAALLAGIGLFRAGVSVDCDDSGSCRDGDDAALWAPGIALLTMGSALSLTSIVMFPVRAAKRGRVRGEIDRIDARLGQLGITASVLPWAPSGSARPAGARLALAF